jgi:hypothetical protein
MFFAKDALPHCSQRAKEKLSFVRFPALNFAANAAEGRRNHKKWIAI